MVTPWTADEAAEDLAAVDAALAELPAGTPAERLQRVARHFAERYGAERGPRRLGGFVRLCLYLERHAVELRARGLVDETGRTVDRAFLEALCGAIASGAGAGPPAAVESSVAAVPAPDVPDDAVEP